MIDLKLCVRTVDGFPKPGIQFRDISSLIANPEAFNQSLLDLTSLTMSFKVKRSSYNLWLHSSQNHIKPSL